MPNQATASDFPFYHIFVPQKATPMVVRNGELANFNIFFKSWHSGFAPALSFILFYKCDFYKQKRQKIGKKKAKKSWKLYLHGRLLAARICILLFFFLKSQRSLTRRKIHEKFCLSDIARHAPQNLNRSSHSHG